MKKRVVIQLEVAAELLEEFEAVAATEYLAGDVVLRQLMREYVFMHGRTVAHEEAQRLDSAKRVSAIVALDALMASNNVLEAVARFADDEVDVDGMANRPHGWSSSPFGV